MAFEGSARPGVALFDRAKQRRVKTTKQTPCPREVRTRPNSTRDVRHDVARRERTRRGGSGVAGVRRASDCVRARGPSPATAEGRPMAALESWIERRVLGIDATHACSNPRRHGSVLARRRARGRAPAMRANAGFSETPSRSSARIPPPCAHPGGGDDPSTRGGSRARRDPPGGAPRASRRASRPPRRPHRSRGFLGFFPAGTSLFRSMNALFPVPRAPKLLSKLAHALVVPRLLRPLTHNRWWRLLRHQVQDVHRVPRGRGDELRGQHRREELVRHPVKRWGSR